jgi:glycolate oxidase iron-sulfur subunit
MEVQLADFVRGTPDGDCAEAILRKCVHCGFCTATCPTYQLLGDELDGPRGRIYLIKELLAGAEVSRVTQTHLDRCLTCRACETTCPSGVEYGRLLDIGRRLADERIARPPLERCVRWLLRRVLSNRRLFALLLWMGRAVRPLLPAALRATIPPRQDAGQWPARAHARRMLVLDGCVQPALAPRINAAAARVLDGLGIRLERVPAAGCCGALPQHLDAQPEALAMARRNVDAWWPLLEQGAEAIVMTASGCGAMVREYGHLLRHDPHYAARAARVASATRDLAEIVAAEAAAIVPVPGRPRVAFQSPCTLQHAQRLGGVVEGLLRRAGFELAPVADAHLCCGSAGTYAMLQPELSRRLRADKLHALEAGAPSLIATANIGCLNHLQAKATVPVVHWVELLDRTEAR